MRKSYIYILLISLFIISCGAPKQVINYQEKADNSFNDQNYLQAIEDYKQYLNELELNGEEPSPIVYSKIAEANFQLENMGEAERYYDWAMAKTAVSENLVILMSQHYQEIDNLSKEITALEYFQLHYSGGKDSLQMRNRLFETYIISENWGKANATWNQLDTDTKAKEQYLQTYFDLNKQLEQDQKCDELAEKLLEFNENNHQALEWMAKKYYNLGENRYQSAMAAYNKKKTTKNYNILLKELDQVTVDLKKSLKYFDQLWEMEDGKKYAIYLANIYARFDDKKKSQYYKSFIE